MYHPQKGRLDILVAVGDRQHPVGIPVGAPAQPTWTWTKGNLAQLLLSGDLEIHAEAFFTAGASEVQVTITPTDGDVSAPARTLWPADGYLVATVPVDADEAGTTFEVNVTATGFGGETLVAPPQQVTLKVGGDGRVDLCAATLGLRATPEAIVADGQSKATITATLRACGGQPVAGKPVQFTPPAGDAALSDLAATTDDRGKAAVTLQAGETVSEPMVTVTARLDENTTVSGQLTVPVRTKRYIHYVWQQTVPAWAESGTRWPAPTSEMPDCSLADTVAYCIDESSITGDGIRLLREGTLAGAGGSFTLDETVGTTVSRSTRSFTLSDPDGDNIRSATWAHDRQVSPDDTHRYRAKRLPPSVVLDEQPEGADEQAGSVSLRGLEAVGELGYRHLGSSRGTSGTAGENPVELPPFRPDLMLVPRGDGSALQYAGELSRPILFPRQDDRTFAPYTYCGTVTKQVEQQPGYYDPAPSTWLIGGIDVNRKRTYRPGDRPMPVGPSQLTAQYALARSSPTAPPHQTTWPCPTAPAHRPRPPTSTS